MLYLKLFCYDYESVVLKGWKNYWDAMNCFDDERLVLDESYDLCTEDLTKCDKKARVLEIMNVMIKNNVHEAYNVLNAEITEEYKNALDFSIEGLVNMYPCIASIDEEVDQFSDDLGNERKLHLCWLKFPYVCEASDCGYFHFSDMTEFNKWIDRCHIMNDEDFEKGCVSSLNYEEFNGVELSLTELKEKVEEWKNRNDYMDLD